ncbi:hypothetical protein AB832_07075 [Flavobacteriaceae bacterium (ex Bugula neritina AB1)]|nr:hypothetical protein AB832_07075 [Flavobacteriaceae bacterium (ex Bugula neritina AB1)]
MELRELYDKITGERLYLNTDERKAFLEATRYEDNDIKYFCQMLFYTGCRLNEGLGVLFSRIDFSEQGVIIETLKQRRKGVMRFVELPDKYLEGLNDAYGIRSKQTQKKYKDDRIWTFTDRTGQNYVKKVMRKAGIDGKKSSPKGLRHSFGVLAVENKIPLTQIQDWLGHKDIKNTSIYTRVKGIERRSLAERMWENT